jgi:DHA2 family multidrug resistance protein
MDPSNPVLNDVLQPQIDISTPAGLALMNGEITRQSMMLGYIDVFAWMVVFILAMYPLIMILRPPPKAPMERIEAVGD